MDSAKAFFAQAHDVVEQPPQRVATVGHTIYPRVIAEDLGEDVEHELTYSHEFYSWDSKGSSNTCRRRRVLTGSIKQQLEILIHDISRQLDCEVISLAIEPEHIHLFLNCPPDIAPAQLMHRIKGATARRLRQDFPELLKLPSMWTRSYFCSTAGNVASITIQKYIEAQGKG